MKDSLENPTHVTKTIGVKNVVKYYYFNNITFRKKIIRNLKITKILSTLFTTVSYCLEALHEVGTEEADE